MSANGASNAKPATTNPAPPGDHRKRKRNRTTQSCLNCHASKRMCDRKRPACQRCTTLGLTGLCVYEVDDPSQRSTASDEKALLRSRVAELEGVIREMKNKPHPRWSQKSQSPPAEISTPQASCNEAQSSSYDYDPESAFEPCPPLMTESHSPMSVPGPTTPCYIQLSPVTSQSGPSSMHVDDVCPQVLANDPRSQNSEFNLPSPPHSPHANSARSAVASLPGHLSNGACTASNFNIDHVVPASTFEPSGFESGIYGHMLDHIMHTDKVGAAVSCAFSTSGPDLDMCCPCISNVAVYNSLLELSVRLRRTAEILSSDPRHISQSMDFKCKLFDKIRKLDRLTSDTLSGATSPSDNQSPVEVSFPLFPGASAGATGASQPMVATSPWDTNVVTQMPAISGGDDDFMSWNSGSRESWTRFHK